jgi:hypothetical protein
MTHLLGKTINVAPQIDATEFAFALEHERGVVRQCVGTVDSGASSGVSRPGPWLSICKVRIEVKQDCIGRLKFVERPKRADQAQRS